MMTNDFQHDQYEDDNGYYIIEEPSEDAARLSHLGNLLVLLGICVVMFLMLNLCWSYCSEEQSDISEERNVIASAVRPGLIIVQNSKNAEETLRIIQEYDVMQGQASPNRFPQQGGIAVAANTRATYLQAASPPYYSNATSFVTTDSVPTETLIDIDMSELCRPPPYAPRAADK